ncbi:class A beta-lactamase-related serine hydrolase [Flavobacterium sp. ANB]|uniref:serine hydrolase domain-containing protein n=1 Tax=unclassified Flavobacterium TaxID=196869 RepID=UPI0012B83C18|nr:MULTISPECIES: serine hydrolase domain-containing protein [unclassified Flavobacterium]MBF4517782.1 class A beta-lactamase-related serine hydrolase [Flavobacterium sp. ANB]MTD70509.1 serine hydrolase [Flavobacterium sp. LC2016-13]
MINLIKLFVSLLILFSFSAGKAQNNPKAFLNTEIDKYIFQIQNRYVIPGISLAVIKNGKVIHKKNYGKANIENDIPVSDKSIFRIYSLTKLIVTTGTFQLIEQGRLSLEDSVSKYISGLPKTWNSIQIKNLLTQSSGLPDIVNYEKLEENVAQEKVFADTIAFKKGEKFEYNQTNFWLLQKVIETVSRQDIETFITQNQFTDISKKSMFFSTDSRDIIPNRVTPYFNYDTGKMQISLPNNGSYLNSCNGINITMDSFLIWDKKLNSNKLINEKSKNSMWETFPYSKSNEKFTFGWDERVINGHLSYGFSGGRITAYRNFPKDNLSIIFLANGLGGNNFDVENIVNQIAYLVDNDIIDYNVLAFESLINSAQNNIDNFKNAFTTLKNNPKYLNVNFEEHLNAIGYILLNEKKTQEAVFVFTLNTTENPKSFNAFDSLGEVCQINKNFEKALLNYTKAKELNADESYQANVSKKIKELEEIIKTTK